MHAPDFVRNDRRILGLGPTSDPREIVRTQEALFELAPDASLRRPDHIRMSNRAFFMDSAIVGTRDGGAFEMPALGVFEIDDLGKLRRADLYDPEQFDAAQARFEQIVALVGIGA